MTIKDVLDEFDNRFSTEDWDDSGMLTRKDFDLLDEEENIKQFIKEQISKLLDSNDRWQPIELAPSDQDIIVYSPRYGVRSPYRKSLKTNNEFMPNHTGIIIHDATCWMPLPEPPKGDL